MGGGRGAGWIGASAGVGGDVVSGVIATSSCFSNHPGQRLVLGDFTQAIKGIHTQLTAGSHCGSSYRRSYFFG